MGGIRAVSTVAAMMIVQGTAISAVRKTAVQREHTQIKKCDMLTAGQKVWLDSRSLIFLQDSWSSLFINTIDTQLTTKPQLVTIVTHKYIKFVKTLKHNVIA